MKTHACDKGTIAFAVQKYNQYIKHIWKVPRFIQEETLECECELGWAIINLKNVGQANCKSVITSFFQKQDENI